MQTISFSYYLPPNNHKYGKSGISFEVRATYHENGCIEVDGSTIDCSVLKDFEECYRDLIIKTRAIIEKKVEYDFRQAYGAMVIREAFKEDEPEKEEPGGVGITPLGIFLLIATMIYLIIR